MEQIIDAAGPYALAVLALVDSTSVGTLVIPVILLVTGTDTAGRVALRTLIYLVAIAVFYLVIGVVLLAGLLPALAALGPMLASGPGVVLLALIGAGLVVWSHLSDPATIRKKGGDPEASARRWTERAQRASGRPKVLVGLAVTAGLMEVVTMVPYLAAMGLIGRMGLGLGEGSAVLAGYCALMILPAAALCGIRALLGTRGSSLLERVHRWSIRHAASAVSWATGIIGVILLVRTLGPAMGVLGIGGRG